MRCMVAAGVCFLLVVVVGCGAQQAARETASSAGSGDAASADDGDYVTMDTHKSGAYSESAEPMPTIAAPDGADSATSSDFSPSTSPAMPKGGEAAASGGDRGGAEPPPSTRKPEIQSGTLTAGSFDDVLRTDDFRSFLNEAMQSDPREVLPRVPVSSAVVIQVIDGQRRPVGGAKVRVMSEASDKQSDELVTASDGRAMYLPGIDGAANGTFQVRVQPSANGKKTTYEMQVGQTPWVIQLPDAEGQLPQRLDLALVIDTTGSMSDELEYLKVEIDSISQTIKSMFPNVDQRFALIVYRDNGDEYVFRSFDFTDSLTTFRKRLGQQAAAGGGDYPEAMHTALNAAGQLSWREGNVARAMFLIADAPPHDGQARASFESIAGLRSKGVRMFPIAASGAQLKAEYLMRSGAYATMGQYLFLTDHSGVGNPHAKPHVPDYQVERLDRLMIRMIASELAAKRLAPTEVIAIERGDREHVMPLVPEVQQQSAAPIMPYEDVAFCGTEAVGFCGTSDESTNWLAKIWLFTPPKYGWAFGVAALLAIGFIVDRVQRIRA